MEFVYAWFGAGLFLAPFSYAITLHYWQHRHPDIAEEMYDDDLHFAVWSALFTFLSPFCWLQIALMYRGPHFGLKWR